jgi:hypothetical protein
MGHLLRRARHVGDEGGDGMTHDEHRERHKELHRSFDELMADFLTHNSGRFPTEVTLMELARWSHEQTIDPIGDRPA